MSKERAQHSRRDADEALMVFRGALETAEHCFLSYATDPGTEGEFGGASRCVGFVFVGEGDSIVLPCSSRGDFLTRIAGKRLGFSLPLVVPGVAGGATLYGAGDSCVIEAGVARFEADFRGKYAWFEKHFPGGVVLRPNYLVLSKVDGGRVRVTRLARSSTGEWELVDQHWKGGEPGTG